VSGGKRRKIIFTHESRYQSSLVIESESDKDNDWLWKGSRQEGEEEWEIDELEKNMIMEENYGALK
jgi:hypothetical protein